MRTCLSAAVDEVRAAAALLAMEQRRVVPEVTYAANGDSWMPLPLPSLVLLPGLDGTGILFKPLIAALPSEVSTLVVAYPGHQPLGYSELLPIVLAALPTHHPFVLLGESFSGPLAVMAAATRPPGLVGLVLCASFVRSPHPYIPSFLNGVIRPSLLKLFPRLSQLKALLGGYFSTPLHALVQEALARVAPTVLARRIREVLSVDVADQLAACTATLLYLKASRDFVVPSWNVRSVKRACPGLHVVELSAPHMLLQVAAEQAAAVLTDFLNTCAHFTNHPTPPIPSP